MTTTPSHTEHTYTAAGIHLCAQNDRDGNPQRVYMVIADDGCRWLYDEGYLGSHAVPVAHRERIAGRWVTINISTAEYHRIMRGI